MNFGVDLSSLNLLSEIVVASSLESCDVLVASAVQVLMELKIMKKKGLLADLDKALFVPKKKRSVLNLSKRTQFLTLLPINNKRSKCPVRIQKKKTTKCSKRTDLLDFIVPKKKRSNLGSDKNRRGNMKRKREDDDQVQSVKRQRSTSTAEQLGCSSSVQLGLPSYSQEIKSIPLWSFQRKSQFRFALIKLHQSPGTTMVV